MKSLEDYIVVLDGVFTYNLCDALLEEYALSNEWQQTSTGSGINTSVRNADTIQLSQSFVLELNYHTRKKLDAYVFASVGHAIDRYNTKFPHCHIEEDSGYEMLRYETGQFYKQHVDSFKAQPRAVSCSVSLNDDYDGGEWAFFDRSIEFRMPKGSAVLFPSNFMYPHEILPVTKGTRYSIVTWFV